MIKNARLPSEAWFGVTLVLLGSIFSSTKAVIIKLAYVYEINAVSLLTLRMIIALPFFLAMGIWSWRRQKVAIRPKDWALLALVGMLGYYLASLFDFIGLQYITAGLERLIVFAYPTLVVLLGALIWRRSISARQWVALVLTYCGILLALSGDVVVPEASLLWKGAFWVFLCALAYALHLLGSEQLIPRMGVMMFSSWAMLAATLGVFVHASVMADAVQLTGYPPRLYQLAILLSVITTILPPYLMSAGIQRLGAGNAAILGSIGPVSTLVLAWWLLEEHLSGVQMIGAAIVLAGVGLVSYRKRKKVLEKNDLSTKTTF
ncbi:MAG: DMT family transporter [Bacteroidia bacterium]|nr:DMT family transporter [Bacteroidia bacterium]